MKNLIFLTLSFIAIFSMDAAAKVSAAAMSYNASNCNWQCYYEYPKSNKDYYFGDAVYVKIKPQNYHHIKYMDLYVDNKFIRRESSYPYEWCKNGGGDNYLRNLSPGWHTIKCKVYDKCGKCHDIFCKIYIKEKGNFCHYNNPCYDLPWLKQLKQKHPDWCIYEYRKNGQPYFKLFKCGVSNCTIYWYNCHGKLVCTCPNNSNCFQGCQMVKCWYNPCQGGGNQGGHCTWKSWFKYPYNNQSFQKGCKVPVRVDCSKYQDIEYMELYCNGKKVRRESMYPYEWCKGNGNSDYQLRNMHKGTYNLKVVIKDKCGKYHQEYCKIYVK